MLGKLWRALGRGSAPDAQTEHGEAGTQPLFSAAVTTVSGVVRPPGCAVVRSPDQGPKTVFFLDPWRVDTGPAETGPLRVEASDDLARLDEVRSNALVRLGVRLDRSAGVALLAEVHSPQPDEAPAAPVTQAAQVVGQDPLFGALTLRPGPADAFEGTAEWAGEEIGISVPAAGGEPDPSALEVARRFWADQEDWDRRLRDRLVADLLPRKNSDWLEDGEEPLTAEDLLARLMLASVAPSADGVMTFHFDDGDVFWRHAVVVEADLETGVGEATLAG